MEVYLYLSCICLYFPHLTPTTKAAAVVQELKRPLVWLQQDYKSNAINAVSQSFTEMANATRSHAPDLLLRFKMLLRFVHRHIFVQVHLQENFSST